MYKVIGILKRPADMPFEEFKTWWLEEHAPKVQKWKGLEEYRINFCTTSEEKYDGVAEVWFERKEDMDAVFNTDNGKVARQSATAGASELVVLLTEEHVIV